MTMSDYLIGVDIGGTKIASGLFTPGGALLARVELPTEQERGFSFSSGRMYATLESLFARASALGGKVTGIGVCAPGPMDPEKGILYNPPNLAGWENLDLKRLLETKYARPVWIDNDANAAGLAEAMWGAARGYQTVFYVTVSTGIGTGIVLDRKIFHGKNGMAGEGGHMTIRYDDERFRCKCGNVGCIEAYASGTSMARRAAQKIASMREKPRILAEMVGERWDTLTAKDIARAAAKGDRFCQDIIRETGVFLGIWLGSVVSILDPDVIVIGGGVSRIGEPLFEAIRSEIPKRTINTFAGKTPVIPAALRENAGIYGAAALALSAR
jgi:glucokinase